MHLIDDWKKQFPRLWSVRLALLAAVLGAAEVGLSFYATGKPPILTGAAVLVSLGAAAARIISQPRLRGEQ